MKKRKSQIYTSLQEIGTDDVKESTYEAIWIKAVDLAEIFMSFIK